MNPVVRSTALSSPCLARRVVHRSCHQAQNVEKCSRSTVDVLLVLISRVPSDAIVVSRELCKAKASVIAERENNYAVRKSISDDRLTAYRSVDIIANARTPSKRLCETNLEYSCRWLEWRGSTVNTDINNKYRLRWFWNCGERRFSRWITGEIYVESNFQPLSIFPRRHFVFHRVAFSVPPFLFSLPRSHLWFFSSLLAVLFSDNARCRKIFRYLEMVAKSVFLW